MSSVNNILVLSELKQVSNLQSDMGVEEGPGLWVEMDVDH